MEVRKVVRASFILLSLSALSAQPTAPVEITGTISQIDTQKWVGFKEGPGLFRTVRNTSGHVIQGYAYETVFIDPETGKHFGGKRGHESYKPPQDGVLITVDGSISDQKPYPVPLTPSGGMPQYSFVVDYVVFDDGTTWGPGKTPMAQQLIRQMKGLVPK